MSEPDTFPLEVDDEIDFGIVDDSDGRLHALARVHRVLRAIHGTSPDILQLDDEEEEEEGGGERYRLYLDIIAAYAEDVVVSDDRYKAALYYLRNRGFWDDVATGFNASISRQYFMEQLIRHRYLRHRAFFPWMYNDDAGVPVEWVACDIDAEHGGVYTPAMPASFMVMHTDDLLNVHVLNGVDAPAKLSFERLYALLDRPMYHGSIMPAAWEDETNNLKLQNAYDPIYFDEIFSSDVANAAARSSLAGAYAPPFMIHDMLMRNQRVQLKGMEEVRISDVVAYVNEILWSASAPYRAINDPVESAYFLRQLFRILSLVF